MIQALVKDSRVRHYSEGVGFRVEFLTTRQDGKEYWSTYPDFLGGQKEEADKVARGIKGKTIKLGRDRTKPPKYVPPTPARKTDDEVKAQPEVSGEADKKPDTEKHVSADEALEADLDKVETEVKGKKIFAPK